MNKLGGWIRLWIAVSLLGGMTASILVFQMPDIRATHEYAMPGTKGSKKLNPAETKFYIYEAGDVSTLVTAAICLPRTLRQIPDELTEDGFIEVGGFQCSSYQRLFFFFGFAMAFSVALLIVGFLALWVRNGFKKKA